MKYQRKLPGFTLIEGLVFLFLFALITAVFFQTYALGTALIQQSKNRLGAVALANQKMEIVRSLDYENIGTLTGIPAGDILEDEDVQVNNSHFHVHTFVQYIDDVYDGILGGSPNDLVPNDSKRVKIEVSWGAATESETIALVSTFAPDGVEQSVGGGILSINVLDSQGNGVPNASVNVVNNTVSPTVNVTTSTDSTGNIFLIGALASTQQYRITFSKGGYYGSATYAPYPTTSFNPTDIHASVVNGVVNQASYIMDEASTLNLRTQNPFGNDTPDIDFRIDGGRQIGTVTGSNPAQPVFGFGEDSSTDSSGEKDYANESYGTYVWTLDPGETNYTFVKLDPEVATGPTSIDLPPGTTQVVKMILADESVNAALITVTNATDGAPVAGASVRLTNTVLSYDTTVTTSLFGKAYFPTVLPGLIAGTYDIEVSATGFTNETDTVDVTSGLATKNVTLSP